ncbi:hypothetical protein [Microbacterium sp.]|uniref:hypothetical protein n=1 Tax=Microbacterium sp. TaxID=51671 RepID=UPI0039E68620
MLDVERSAHRSRRRGSRCHARAWSIGVLVLALMVSSSCSGKSDEVGAAFTPVDLADYADVEAHLDFEAGTVVMPLDNVRAVTPRLADMHLRAIWAVTDACLSEHGYPTVSNDVDWPPVAPDEDRIFGRWSVALASRYGAALDPTTREGFRIETVSRGVDYNKQLTSCWDETQVLLQQELAFIESTSNVDYQIYIQSYRSTLSSDQGKAALLERTQCMERQGVVVDEATQLPSSAYAAKSDASVDAVRVAVVAAQCGVETGAIQQLYNVLARYQAAYIDQREAQLVALREKATVVEARLARVLQDVDEFRASPN